MPQGGLPREGFVLIHKICVFVYLSLYTKKFSVILTALNLIRMDDQQLGLSGEDSSIKRTKPRKQAIKNKGM